MPFHCDETPDKSWPLKRITKHLSFLHFQKVTEFYQFRIHYNTEGAQMNFGRRWGFFFPTFSTQHFFWRAAWHKNTGDHLTRWLFAPSSSPSISTPNEDFAIAVGSTKKASILLVRKLYILMQNLGPLPNKIFLNMTLTYYDEGKRLQGGDF